jgi:hypothetical protein
VTADDGDLVLGRVLGLAKDRGEEGRGSDNVEVGHTEQAGEGMLVRALFVPGSHHPTQ